MAKIVWTEPALTDLDAIADYIALENPDAASALVRQIFEHVEQLAEFPNSGSHLPEMQDSRYRQIVEPPCRVIYRADARGVTILHVMRSAQTFRRSRLGR